MRNLVRFCVAVPLVVEGNIIGVINLLISGGKKMFAGSLWFMCTRSLYPIREKVFVRVTGVPSTAVVCS